MSATPTPGPWLRDGLTVYALDGGRNRFSARVSGDFSGAPPEELEAIARLMEAAPELLDALKEFMDIWGSGDSNSPSKRAQKRRAEMWRKADAAIEKAEGRL